jgi:hypothetical protein
MSVLNAAERKLVLDAAKALPFTAPSQRIEDFVSNILGLNPLARASLFPDPDPHGHLALIVGEFTSFREDLLREDGVIPEYIVTVDPLGRYFIQGLSSYLVASGADQRLINRLPHHRTVRNSLIKIQRGHHLEAVAAALLASCCEHGTATQGSGDQGIDALGWHTLIRLERAFVSGDVPGVGIVPGERTFILASSKAILKVAGGRRASMDPAYIRELVGGWVIQRTHAGLWRKQGIQMLTPVQMVLVTTYKLSESAKAECRELGVQSWTLPELIYLVMLKAPDNVFDPASGFAFSLARFRDWWKPFHSNRLAAAS